MKSSNNQFSGIVTPQNENDFYSIRYAEFVIPLINSIKEQQTQIDSLKNENQNLRIELKRLDELEKRFNQLEKK